MQTVQKPVDGMRMDTISGVMSGRGGLYHDYGKGRVITFSIMTLLPVVFGAQGPDLHANSFCLAAQQGQKCLSMWLGPYMKWQALALCLLTHGCLENTMSWAGLSWSRDRARRNSYHLSSNGSVSYLQGDQKGLWREQIPLNILGLHLCLLVWDKLLIFFCPEIFF